MASSQGLKNHSLSTLSVHSTKLLLANHTYYPNEWWLSNNVACDIHFIQSIGVYVSLKNIDRKLGHPEANLSCKFWFIEIVFQINLLTLYGIYLML